MSQIGTYDLACRHGASFRQRMRFYNNETPIAFSPSDAALVHVRPTQASTGAPVLVFSKENGCAVLDNQGWLTLTQAEAAINALPTGRYVYDVQLTQGGTTSKYLAGAFIVYGGVTRTG